MSELPNSWAQVPMAEIAEVNPRKSVDLIEDDLVSFVPMASVDEISGTIAAPINRPYSEVSQGFTHFRDEDVIFAKITPSMENGKSAVARDLSNGTGMGSTEFHVFRSFGAVEPSYLWRYVRQQSFRDDARNVMSGAVGQQRVPADWLKQHLIPIAPLAEQRRIVAKLDSLTKRTDHARRKLDSVPTLISNYKQRLLALATNGALSADWRSKYGSEDWLTQGFQELGQRREEYEKSKRGSRLRAAPPLKQGQASTLPRTWISCSVADVADLRVGYAFKSQWFSSEGTRLLRGANVAPGRINWADERRLTKEHASNYENYRLETGDVVIAMDRPLISTGLKIAIVDEDSAGALLVQRVANPRPTTWLHPKYLFYVLNGQDFISQIEKHATGSDLPHITGNDILTTALPLPPIDEQAEIVRRIEAAFNWLDRVSEQTAAARRLLPKLDEAILARAFRGELLPQDPDDEPASALLERYSQKRASSQPAKKHSTRTKPMQPRTLRKAKVTMMKSRRDDDVWQKPYLAEKLKGLRSSDVQSLFRVADLPVADFYKQLAWEITKKHIIDDANELKAA